MNDRIIEREIKQFELNSEKIKKILYAAMNTRFYSEYLKNIDINNISYYQFADIPVLNKSDINNNMIYMLNDRFSEFNKIHYDSLPYEKKRDYLSKFNLELRVTSGSTGAPVEVIKSKSDIRKDYLMLNYYRHRLSNYDFKGPFLWVWPVNPLTKKYFYPDEEAEKFWKVNRYGTQYMLYTYSEENLHIMYDYIIKQGIEWITISPSALMTFIDYLNSNNLLIPHLKYIECHSEKLYYWQRKKIKDTFLCDVSSIYSSNEVQFIAGTNDDQMRLFSNNCFMELIDNGLGSKNVYVTSLSYTDIPIIRYRLGDCAEWCISNNITENNTFDFELKGYRENDFIIGKNGSQYESFIITDSIVLLQNTYKLNINKYRVKQKGIYIFEYSFDNTILLPDKLVVKQFLEKYLSEIFMDRVEVQIVLEDISKYYYNGSKMKYIEIDKNIR